LHRGGLWLQAEVQLINQLSPGHRTDYLANAADLYLRPGDKEAAVTVVQSGFEVAALLLAQDSQSKGLQGLPKAVWPSVEVYRRMISLGVNADFEKTRTACYNEFTFDLLMMARCLNPNNFPCLHNVIRVSITTVKSC